jgi:uncharacterized protein (DUF1697 family)
MTQVAWLRAVNVGGRGVVKMADVRAAFEAAGCRDVRTFIASGNVLFTPGSKSVVAQQKKIAAAMHDLMGATIGIAFRALADVEALLAAKPFARVAADPAVKLYVAFLEREPASMPPLPLVDTKEAVEVITRRGLDLLIVSRPKPNGMYGFPTLVVERLGVAATARNWNTVSRLVDFARTR